MLSSLSGGQAMLDSKQGSSSSSKNLQGSMERERERERERDGVDEQWMMAMLEEWGEEMDRSSLLGRQPGRSSVGVE
uniref:Uncharacterized protein n=1 Tax=Oryza sativa subsp. japonica TaxID=39947 RepID=Q6K5X0_ORYSJ|nr:hypothetical protein [Oryza sativa Japonica Group]BAD22028.1 hypothetical protein [Oryza sativa Japonica Group]